MTDRAVVLALCVALWTVLFAATPASAIDATEPARVHMIVTDEEGKPLPEAHVRLRAVEPDPLEVDEPAVERTSDAEGRVAFHRRRPEKIRGVAWRETYRIEREGHIARDHSLPLFPGARHDIAVPLDRERTTRIRLRDGNGKPLPGVTFEVYYSKEGYTRSERLVADQQGEALWRHGRLKDGFFIPALTDSSGTWGQPRFEPQPVVTVAFDMDPLAMVPRRLAGKLLRADGSTAAGWLVAGKADEISNWTTRGYDWRTTVALQELTRVGADGRFEAEVNPQGRLVVVSPQGIPLLYGLNPQTWPADERDITLRLPAVRREHHGVVVDEEGKPVAGLPIELHAVIWQGQHWHFTTSEANDRWEGPFSEATASDGSPIETIRTDAEGRYTIPIYFGSAAEFYTHREGWSHWFDLATSHRHIWKREPAGETDLAEYKRVILVFEDEQGEPSRDIAPDRSYRDSRGWHKFVERTQDRLDLQIRDAPSHPARPKWRPIERTIELTDEDEQVVRITLDETDRLQPLSGRVLDPDGAPVPEASVSLLKPESDPTAIHHAALGISMITNERGEFSFEAAPDDCRIEVSRYPMGRAGDDFLPSWMTPLAVDRQTRDVTVRLNRGGSVRVLLPAAMGDEVEGIYLVHETPPEDQRRRGSISLAHDAQRNELSSRVLPPDRYILSAGQYASRWTELFASFDVIRADVQSGEETVVDLRDLEIPEHLLPVERRKSWNTVVVKHQGEKAAGAEVVVYAAAARPQDVARWIEQWKTGDATVRRGALTMLESVGALAVDTIRAASDDLLDDAQRDELLEEVGFPTGDGLHQLTLDLTDDSGTLRCEIEKGRQCVAVARVRGRLIGWQPFVAEGGAVTVELGTARTLALRLEEADPDPALDSWADLRVEEPAGLEMRALMAALCQNCSRVMPDMDSWISAEAVLEQRYLMAPDGSAGWVSEDLPVGFTGTVIVSSDRPSAEELPPRHISIEPGDGVQTVAW